MAQDSKADDKEILDLNYLFEDNNNTKNKNINDKDNDMIADDTMDKDNTICICGAELILTTAGSCYDDCKEIECDGCGKTVKGNKNVYHCKNKKTDKHSEGYDLCKSCYSSPNNMNNNDGFDNFIFSTINNLNNNQENIIISPLSILVAMTICMLGSAENTLKQMLNVLYSNKKNKSLTFENSMKITNEINTICQYFNKQYDASNNKPIIKIANKIWIEKDFKILDKYIAATNVDSVGVMDKKTNSLSQIVQIIHKWCADNTNNMIKEIVNEDIINDTVLLIANAIYFKGKFKNEFSKKRTKKNIDFYVNKNRKKKLSKVSMMYSNKKQFYIKKYNDYYDIVKLQYKKSDLSLILVINNYSIRKKPLLTTKDLKILNNKWKHGKIDLFVPKFKFEYKSQLNDILQKMGIIDAFAMNADFSNMTGDKGLCVGTVIHKAVIEVDETGTEAAAVTVVTMRSKNCAARAPPSIPTIRFDHPFVFYIFDQTKQTVLFSGVFVGKK